MQAIVCILIISMAFMESWLQPWMAVAGVALPLTLMGLAALHTKVNPKLLPWLGLTVGTIIDLGSANYFGVNMLFYLVISWLLSFSLPSIHHKKKLWVKAGLVIVAALAQPWFLLLANRQFSVDIGDNILISIIRAVCVVAISLISIWLLSRQEATTI